MCRWEQGDWTDDTDQVKERERDRERDRDKKVVHKAELQETVMFTDVAHNAKCH